MIKNGITPGGDTPNKNPGSLDSSSPQHLSKVDLEPFDEKTPLLHKHDKTASTATLFEDIPRADPSLPRSKRKRINRFYDRQYSIKRKYSEDRHLVEDLEAVDGDTHLEGMEAAEIKKLRKDRILAQVTFAINVGLLIAKTVVAILTNSLSVISSVVDSAVDVTSGVVIWVTTKAMEKPDPYRYPRGRSKLEPLAVVIVAVIMAVASMQVIIQSITSITDNKVNPTVDISSVVIMGTAIAIKLVLFVICWRIGTPSAMVLAQDHRNDLVSNTVAIVAAVLAERFWIYIDPIGAILVALYIIVTWCITGAEQIPVLTGKTASPQVMNRIIKLAIDHDPRINSLETIYVYHYGARFLVELHIILDQHMMLRESHDICESLQLKLEHLPYVERAFIHCDYGPDTCQCVCGVTH